MKRNRHSKPETLLIELPGNDDAMMITWFLATESYKPFLPLKNKKETNTQFLRVNKPINIKTNTTKTILPIESLLSARCVNSNNVFWPK